jgi:hypothetical protein
MLNTLARNVYRNCLGMIEGHLAEYVDAGGAG